MNNFGITEKTYQILRDTFSEYPEVQQVIIFGSRAKGNFQTGSDIDFAIKGEQCSEKLALNISSFLNECLPLPYHFDVLNYKSLNHRQLKNHINTHGKIFYESAVTNGK